MTLIPTARPVSSLEIPADFLARILAPYKPHCRYVRSIREVRGEGSGEAPGPAARFKAELAIPESCYIDETGHFNAVEFNLCFNQIYYIATGWCIAHRRLPAAASMDLGEYLRRQLPDVLIHEFHSSFQRPIQRQSFTADFAIVSALRQRRWILFKTRCVFQDPHGGSARGEVTLILRDEGGSAVAEEAG